MKDLNYPHARAELKLQIERIRAYTLATPALRACHHFCYDFRLGEFERARFIVMGMNPGETADDRLAAPGPAEESSLVDYREGRDSASRARWFATCRRIVGSNAISLTELCFWSSSNIPALVERIGPLERSPHLEFCRALNDELIAFHKPVAIVLPGLGLRTLTAKLYNLNFVKREVGANGKTLIEHYQRAGVPWVFTKHWSGSFGFSNEDKAQIAQYLHRLDAAPPASGFDAVESNRRSPTTERILGSSWLGRLLESLLERNLASKPKKPPVRRRKYSTRSPKKASRKGRMNANSGRN